MNPFLKGEKAQTVQLGFNSYRPDLIITGDVLRLKALWYHSKLTDYIYSRGYILCRTHADDEYHRCLNNDDALIIMMLMPMLACISTKITPIKSRCMVMNCRRIMMPAYFIRPCRTVRKAAISRCP